ncbi:MAG: hypothetical protein R3C31_10400 [Hyphomonadaceae bacterium]
MTAARSGKAVDVDRLLPPGDAFGDGRGNAAHAARGDLDGARGRIDRSEVGTADFDANGAFDAGRQHVDAVADQRHPHWSSPAPRRGRALRSSARGVMPSHSKRGRNWIDGLEHFERRGIGLGLSPTRLPNTLSTSGTAVRIKRSVCCSSSDAQPPIKPAALSA